MPTSIAWSALQSEMSLLSQSEMSTSSPSRISAVLSKGISVRLLSTSRVSEFAFAPDGREVRDTGAGTGEWIGVDDTGGDGGAGGTGVGVVATGGAGAVASPARIIAESALLSQQLGKDRHDYAVQLHGAGQLPS
jgi:hypothetical protein